MAETTWTTAQLDVIENGYHDVDFQEWKEALDRCEPPFADDQEQEDASRHEILDDLTPQEIELAGNMSSRCSYCQGEGGWPEVDADEIEFHSTGRLHGHEYWARCPSCAGSGLRQD